MRNLHSSQALLIVGKVVLINKEPYPDEGFGFECRLGCQWDYHRVWIVPLPIALVDFCRIDLLFVVRYF